MWTRVPSPRFEVRLCGCVRYGIIDFALRYAVYLSRLIRFWCTQIITFRSKSMLQITLIHFTQCQAHTLQDIQWNRKHKQTSEISSHFILLCVSFHLAEHIIFSVHTRFCYFFFFSTTFWPIEMSKKRNMIMSRRCDTKCQRKQQQKSISFL